MVRKIRFDDGVEWIARLRMSPTVDPEQQTTARPPEQKYGEYVVLEMRSELATMGLSG